jgi:DNA-binding LacI/PurR family transcriptional regulator
MADVARHAGVSSQTVSRVANGHSNVDAATRERVVQAMQELGYRPNGAARALRTGRFRTIGVIIFTLETLGNLRTLDAITTEAAHAGYSVMLMPVYAPTLVHVSGAYSRMSEQAVDGVVIIFEAHLLDHAEFALPPGLPFVVVTSSAASRYSAVDTDQVDGARQATRHLLELGHRRVWHIAGPQTSFAAALRAGSWRRTLQEAGIDPPEPLYGDWSAESGYRCGLTLAAQPEVTAIFAGNDQMALGALRALHESGRSVPADVSIVGFDDMQESGSFFPPLTTVHQDFATVGRLSIRRLLEKVAEGPRPGPGPGPGPGPDQDRDGNPADAHADGVTGEPEKPDMTVVPTRLVIRESTAPPRK